MYGTTAQEGLDSGAKIIFMARAIPQHSNADQLMAALKKQTSEQNSQFFQEGREFRCVRADPARSTKGWRFTPWSFTPGS